MRSILGWAVAMVEREPFSFKAACFLIIVGLIMMYSGKAVGIEAVQWTGLAIELLSLPFTAWLFIGLRRS